MHTFCLFITLVHRNHQFAKESKGRKKNKMKRNHWKSVRCCIITRKTILYVHFNLLADVLHSQHTALRRRRTKLKSMWTNGAYYIYSVLFTFGRLSSRARCFYVIFHAHHCCWCGYCCCRHYLHWKCFRFGQHVCN